MITSRASGQAAEIAERPSHSAVRRRQRLRAGEQIRSAVASQRQVGEIEAGHRFAEDDRDAADRAVARIRRDGGDRTGERSCVGRPRVARVAGERVPCRIDDVGTARGERHNVTSLRAGERGQAADDVGDVVARIERLAAGEQVAARSRTGVACERQIAQVESGYCFGEDDRDRTDGRVARVGRDVRDVGGRSGRIDGPRFGRVAAEDVRGDVDDAGRRSGERE